MKKIYGLIFSVILVGCVGLFSPSKTIINPKCETNERLYTIKIQQVSSDGVLAIPYYKATQHYIGGYGKVVFIEKKEFKKDVWNKLYDELEIDASDVCLIFEGVYSYTTVLDTTATIRKAKIIYDKTILNPKYEKWEKEQEVKTKSE